MTVGSDGGFIIDIKDVILSYALCIIVSKQLFSSVHSGSLSAVGSFHSF